MEDIKEEMGDMQPLMSESRLLPPIEELPADSVQHRDTSHDPKYLYCFSMKCAVYFFGVFILLDLVLECVHAYFISQNEYFEDPYELYYYIYIILLLPLFVAATLFMLYFCAKDSTYERTKLPLAVLLACITGFLVSIWILVYISALYQYDDVFVGIGDKADEGQEETNYRSLSKSDYVVIFGAWPFLASAFYFVSWLDTKDFIYRNEGYAVSR